MKPKRRPKGRATTTAEVGLQAAAENDPAAARVYSDWLMEHERPEEAAKLLAKIGDLKLIYRLRSVLDRGTDRYWEDYWTLRDARRGHTAMRARRDLYPEEMESDWEIVLIGCWEREFCTLPAEAQRRPRPKDEPKQT